MVSIFIVAWGGVGTLAVLIALKADPWGALFFLIFLYFFPEPLGAVYRHGKVTITDNAISQPTRFFSSQTIQWDDVIGVEMQDSVIKIYRDTTTPPITVSLGAYQSPANVLSAIARHFCHLVLLPPEPVRFSYAPHRRNAVKAIGWATVLLAGGPVLITLFAPPNPHEQIGVLCASALFAVMGGVMLLVYRPRYDSIEVTNAQISIIAPDGSNKALPWDVIDKLAYDTTRQRLVLSSEQYTTDFEIYPDIEHFQALAFLICCKIGKNQEDK